MPPEITYNLYYHTPQGRNLLARLVGRPGMTQNQVLDAFRLNCTVDNAPGEVPTFRLP